MAILRFVALRLLIFFFCFFQKPHLPPVPHSLLTTTRQFTFCDLWHIRAQCATTCINVFWFTTRRRSVLRAWPTYQATSLPVAFTPPPSKTTMPTWLNIWRASKSIAKLTVGHMKYRLKVNRGAEWEELDSKKKLPDWKIPCNSAFAAVFSAK